MKTSKTKRPTPRRGESAGPKVAETIDWRAFDPSWLPGAENAPLATELATYRDDLDELLKRKGWSVVIKRRSVLGCYRDRQAALAAAFHAYGAVPVLVKQIVETEPVRWRAGLA